MTLVAVAQSSEPVYSIATESEWSELNATLSLELTPTLDLPDELIARFKQLSTDWRAMQEEIYQRLYTQHKEVAQNETR